MSLASSRENTSKKSWYSGGTTLAISAPSSVGRGSAWSTVVGAGSLPTALRWVCLVGRAPGLTLSMKTLYPWSMSFLKAVAPMMLIGGGHTPSEWYGTHLLRERKVVVGIHWEGICGIL